MGLCSILPYESSSSTQLSCCSSVSESWQLPAPAGHAVRGKSLRALPIPTAFPLQHGEEVRTLKGVPQGCKEVKDCLEEKAEVKIKNRERARIVQTGAGAITAEYKTPLTCPGAIVGRARTHTDFNWDQFHKYHLLQSPSIDWKPNKAYVSGDRFSCFPPLPHNTVISELAEILC